MKAGVWVETVTESGRRFMFAWRKDKEDVARHRQEKRKANEQTRKVVILNGRLLIY